MLLPRTLVVLSIAFVLANTAFAQPVTPGVTAPPEKSPRVGFIFGSGPSESAKNLTAFRQRLQSLGYVEGRTLQVDVRYAEGKPERATELVSELLASNVDVLVTGSTRVTQAAQRATSTLPIVMYGVGDPVAAGIVRSFDRPGLNITGVALHIGGQEALAQRLAFLREMTPGSTPVVVLYNPANQSNVAGLAQMEAAARAQGATLTAVQMRNVGELRDVLVRANPAALFAFEDPVAIVGRQHIIEFARERRIPAMYGLRVFAEDGGLMSYGASLEAHARIVADYVDKILRGARPADLAVAQPEAFELVLNLKTANAIGLAVPSSLLQRADYVIE